MKLLTDTYKHLISCEISCYDRLILTGTLPEISYAQGMTSYLNSHEIRIFDYAQFAEPFKALIRSNAEQLAKDSGIEIEFIRKSHVRKESIISAKIAERGNAPAWFISSPQWNLVIPLSRGMISLLEKLSSNPIKASVFIIISISLMNMRVFAICAFLPGALSGCRYM